VAVIAVGPTKGAWNSVGVVYVMDTCVAADPSALTPVPLHGVEELHNTLVTTKGAAPHVDGKVALFGRPCICCKAMVHADC
jgi:hypothetical protein